MGETAAFEDEYRKQFSRPVPGMKIETLNWSVQVATKDGQILPAPLASDNRAFVAYETRPITCDVDETTKEAAFVVRADLSPGDIYMKNDPGWPRGIGMVS